ncbi:hypothetical protein CDEST_02812 [Colletotrichum destructivum]|uniref:Uncharacterized protein n=1 Tax=Colletotrichum destructivum TaxID=34406 RepID=A0AAX4I471_9PEZI|nr:hypothetical protein CDEST_02812 [Colletotrichum destructivum]
MSTYTHQCSARSHATAIGIGRRRALTPRSSRYGLLPLSRALVLHDMASLCNSLYTHTHTHTHTSHQLYWYGYTRCNHTRIPLNRLLNLKFSAPLPAPYRSFRQIRRKPSHDLHTTRIGGAR